MAAIPAAARRPKLSINSKDRVGLSTDLCCTAAIHGLGDGNHAVSVVQTFGDQATSNVDAAKAAIDQDLADASGGGELLFNLVGIVDIPLE